MSNAGELDTTNSQTRRHPLVHPAVLTAVLALIINDHVIKVHWPGPIAGKLSDVVGLVFVPLVPMAIWELATFRRSKRLLALSVWLAGALFTAIQVSSVAGATYVGVTTWLLSPMRGGLAGPILHTADPTDLLALPFLLIPWRLGVRSIESSS